MPFKPRVVGQTIQGLGHLKDGIVCQDKVCTRRYKGYRTAFIAVADGAGSCSHSHFGAQFVVDSLAELVSKNFLEIFLQSEGVAGRLLTHLVDGLTHLASNYNIPFKQLSSTVMFVATYPEKKHFKYIAGHLGDGVVGVLKDGEVSVLSFPDNAEYANTTYFVTSSNAESKFKIFKGEMQYGSGFILMTDGAAESLYHKRSKVLAPACLRVFDWVEQFPQKKMNGILQKNLEVIRTSTRDDCGVALLKYVKY